MIKEEVLLKCLYVLFNPEIINYFGLDYLILNCGETQFAYALPINTDYENLDNLIKEWVSQKGELKGEQA